MDPREGNAFRLFTLFGTPIYLKLSYLFLLLIFTFPLFRTGMGAVFVVAFAVTLSLLVHEFGHVMAARWDGHHSVVVLWGLGGYTIPEGRTRGWRAIRLSAAGPVAGFLLWAVAWFVFMPEGIVQVEGRVGALASAFQPMALLRFVDSGELILAHFLWAELCWINLIWGIFNLLPSLPLDGGHIVQEALKMRMRALEADRVAARVGIVASLAAGGAFLYFFDRPVIAVVLAGFLAFQNWERLQQLR